MYFPEWLYTIDIFFAVFVLVFMFVGIKQGLSGELAHVVTLVTLMVCVCFFYPQMIQRASGFFPTWTSSAVSVVVWVLLLFSAGLLFFIVRLIFKKFVKSQLSEAGDKILGGLAGMVRGALIGLLLFFGLSLMPGESVYQVLSEKSAIGAWVCNTLTPWVQPRLMELPVLKNKVQEMPVEETTEE